MVSVPPHEFVGTVHDRAPMVLLPEQYGAWLAGGDEATALIGVHPNADAFEVRPARPRRPWKRLMTACLFDKCRVQKQLVRPVALDARDLDRKSEQFKINRV